MLLHGGYGSWRHWAKTIPAFSATHTLYVPDLPGLGDSSNVPEPASLCAIASFVASGLLRLLSGEQAVQLVGFSFGAVVGGYVAAVLGERTAGLTLVGPGSLGLARPPIPLESWRHEREPQAMRRIHRTNLGRLMISDAGRIDELAVEIQFQSAKRARLKSRSITAFDALSSVLRRATPARLCTIFGEHDAIVGQHMSDRQALMQDIQPRSQFNIIPGAGHWVAYEAPEAFNNVLRGVLASGSAACPPDTPAGPVPGRDPVHGQCRRCAT
jgi:pimeloyl-ACP methyl ester carboxylesterase